MTQLTNEQIGQVYGDYLTTTNSGQGLPATTPVPVQDGLGNNSPITMSQTIVNITRGGNQFQLDGVPLTASAASINATATSRIIDDGSNLFVAKTAGNTGYSGTQNTGLGNGCLSLISSGVANTALGFSALASIGTGVSNTATGAGALQKITNDVSNSAFGSDAGSNQFHYNNCSFFGANADASVNNLTNACAIGANASVATSNSIVLGNGCNVGIGTSSPANALHVVGKIQQKGITSGWSGTSLITGQLSVQTTNNTPVIVNIANVPDDSAGIFIASFIAIDEVISSQAASSNESIVSVVTDGAGNVISLAQNPSFNIVNTGGMAGVAVSWVVEGLEPHAVGIQVTGLSLHIINWVITYRYYIVSQSTA